MRSQILAVLTALSVALVGAVPEVSATVSQERAPFVASAKPVAKVTEGVTAWYEMNESAGATVMDDISGNEVDGAISASAAAHGLTTGGGLYTWSLRDPTNPPVEDERVVRVNDNSAIEPGEQKFTLEIRYRTSKPYGNIIQKGQALATGGQWKVQAPGGRPSCLFQGAVDQVAARVPVGLEMDDNQFHELKCVFTPTGDNAGVKVFRDGDRVAFKNGVAGVVDNNAPMSIGGKLNCDQMTTTCDYFNGDIDWVKITKGKDPTPNLKPTAKFTRSCVSLACDFDSTGTADPDGSIASYSWNFGDGATSTQASPSHTFGSAGSKTVTLTVTDNGGATDNAVRTFTVSSAPTDEPPGAPSSVVAKRGDRSVTVSWVAPGDAGGSPIRKYKVIASPDADSCTSTADVLHCTITGLKNGQAYTFKVRAQNTAGYGDPSAQTNAVVPAGRPGAPSSVKVKAGNHKVTVSWSAARSNGAKIRSYIIRKTSGGKPKVVAGKGRKIVFAHLKNGHKYRFAVTAKNAVGKGPARTSKVVKPRAR